MQLVAKASSKWVSFPNQKFSPILEAHSYLLPFKQYMYDLLGFCMSVVSKWQRVWNCLRNCLNQFKHLTINSHFKTYLLPSLCLKCSTSYHSAKKQQLQQEQEAPQYCASKQHPCVALGAAYDGGDHAFCCCYHEQGWLQVSGGDPGQGWCVTTQSVPAVQGSFQGRWCISSCGGKATTGSCQQGREDFTR